MNQQKARIITFVIEVENLTVTCARRVRTQKKTETNWNKHAQKHHFAILHNCKPQTVKQWYLQVLDSGAICLY